MSLPTANPAPEFNITRASHIVLSSKDLEATRAFYQDVLGFDVTHQTDDRLYLRGLEERSHHSVVFHKQAGPRSCKRMGYRMYTDDDIVTAFDHFSARGENPKMVEIEYQGLTLHVTDPCGVPLEFCATMDQPNCQLQQFHTHKGGKPMYFDHTQIFVHDVPSVMHWYSDLGFRMTEIIGSEGSSTPPAVWLQRKGATQDVVFNTGTGPQLHHFAFHAPGISDLIHAADMAASLGYASSVERGPGRHGISNALFLYFRDPDGHRVELFTNHYMAIDSNHKTIHWEPSDPSKAQVWGMPATERFYTEATPFEGHKQTKPLVDVPLVTLEKYLESQINEPPR